MSGRHRKLSTDELDEPPAGTGAGPVAPEALEPPRPAEPSAAVTPPGSTVVARRDRAAERARRQAAVRRRTLVGFAAAGVVLVAAGLATFLLTRDDEEPAERVSAGPPKQQTLLVQVTGNDGVAAANALVGVTPEQSSASVVLVPSRLLVDAAGTGSLPFGETVTLPERSAPAQALTDLLGVRVDDSWVLTAGGLGEIVDAVGGVQAVVDVDVVETDADGQRTLVLRAGSQDLGGTAASSYATYLAEDEPEQARLARFDDVFSAVVAGLPEERSAVAALVRGGGGGLQSTLDPASLAARLSVMRDAAAAGTWVSDVLPVTEIDTGDSVPTYGIDSGQVAAMMRSLLPGALQTGAGGEVLRVLVENGVGTPGLVELARAKLVAEGFRFVNGGNAADFGFDESAVIIPDGTEASVRRGQRVAVSLGLPESAVTTSDRGQTVADVIVILGKDFVP